MENGCFDLAKKYYLRFLDEFPDNNQDLISVYEELSEITSQKKDFNESVKWQQKALGLRSHIPLPSQFLGIF